MGPWIDPQIVPLTDFQDSRPKLELKMEPQIELKMGPHKKLKPESKTGPQMGLWIGPQIVALLVPQGEFHSGPMIG